MKRVQIKVVRLIGKNNDSSHRATIPGTKTIEATAADEMGIRIRKWLKKNKVKKYVILFPKIDRIVSMKNVKNGALRIKRVPKHHRKIIHDELVELANPV